MLRRVLTSAVMAAAVMAQPLPVHGQESFVFEGSGWGHAVGFSQWGGYGQAQEDPSKPGEQIAAHYFPGTAPASLSDLELPNDLLTAMERPLWINLGVQITLLEFTPVGGPVDLCQAGDGEGSCPKPEQPQEGERWQFRRLDVGRCGFFKDGEMQGAEGECRASISWPEADGVQLRYGPDRRRICALRSGECEYRRGELKIRDDPVEEGFHVVLAVGLEDYLRGIAEVPAYWEAPGVNEAQAVAARTYAVFKFFQYERAPRPEDPDWDPGVGPSRRDSCWCHMYDNTRDQEYVGWRREDGPVHAAWVSGVEATQGRVLTYFGPDWERYTKGGVIQGFYSASTGGVTTSNRYGFFTEWDGKTPSQKPWPYLTPVDDSWAVDPQLGNPHVSWRREITASRLAEILEWDEVAAVELEAGPSLSSPARVRFTGTDGGEEVTKTAAGAWLRYGLGLRSSHITAVDGRSAPPSEEPEEPMNPTGRKNRSIRTSRRISGRWSRPTRASISPKATNAAATSCRISGTPAARPTSRGSEPYSWPGLPAAAVRRPSNTARTTWWTGARWPPSWPGRCGRPPGYPATSRGSRTCRDLTRTPPRSTRWPSGA